MAVIVACYHDGAAWEGVVEASFRASPEERRAADGLNRPVLRELIRRAREAARAEAEELYVRELINGDAAS